MRPRRRRRGAIGLLLQAALACVPVVPLLLAGCASRAPHTRRLASSVFLSARHVGRPAARHAPAGDETAAMVVERIHAAGFRFGTDGTPAALWGYMRTSHDVVDAEAARPGDVVFFDTRSRDDDGLDACADRVGVVEQVEPGGRITFAEARGGQWQRAYVDPRLPLVRRDERGQILNSFLRPKRLSDPDGTRYFAGDMLCGVARIRSR